MKTLAFIESCGLLHWAVAFAGIICLFLVRIIGVNEFSMRKWINENLIGVIWSLFILSLVITITHEYLPGFRLFEAFLAGFSGTYVILRIFKEPKPKKKHPQETP